MPRRCGLTFNCTSGQWRAKRREKIFWAISPDEPETEPRDQRGRACVVSQLIARRVVYLRREGPDQRRGLHSPSLSPKRGAWRSSKQIARCGSVKSIASVNPGHDPAARGLLAWNAQPSGEGQGCPIGRAGAQGPGRDLPAVPASGPVRPQFIKVTLERTGPQLARGAD